MPPNFQTNGNGSITIPGWFLAAVGIIFFIVGAVASLVTAQNSVRNDVDNTKALLDKEIADTKEMKQLVIDCDKTTSIIDERLKNIEASIVRIEASMNHD